MSRMKLTSLFASLLALVSFSSFAASPIPVQPATICQTSASLSVTSVSANVALPCSVASFPTLLVINEGAVEAFWVSGNVSVIATQSGVPIPPGSSISIYASGAGYVAGIVASGTTTLRIVQANGAINPYGTGSVSSPSIIPTGIIPPLLTGYGTLSITTSSVALSSMVVGPNSPAYPSGALPNKYVRVKNSVNSTSAAYVCWLGGLCSSSVGEPLAIGESATQNLGTSTTSPTVISGGSASIEGQW